MQDPLLGLLPTWQGEELGYGPAVWGPQAYGKSFDKFFYAQPDTIAVNYPLEWEFATWALKREYAFLQDSVILPLMATDKNTDSTPAYPKTLFHATETDYIDAHGFDLYLEELSRIEAGARPIPLWYLFLKKETLKEKKIRDNDIRQILCSDPLFARIGLMFEQDQNTRMKNRTEHQHGQCGWTPYEGGWADRMERLRSVQPAKYIEMDWTRYDGTIPVEVFQHIKRVRWNFLSPEYRTRKNYDIYRWYCKNITRRYVLLPSGEVTLQERGNPSGQVSTTMDNNMCNTFLQAFEFIYCNDLTIDEAKYYWPRYDTIVYGDDRLTATPLYSEDYTSRVIDMYKKIFGMWVKPENVKVSDTLEGLSFCGFTNRLVDELEVPVPTNVNKLISSLIQPTTKLPDLESLMGKLVSFRILMHNLPDDNPGKRFIEECEVALRRHATAQGVPYVNFTKRMIDYLWRGGPVGDYGGRRRQEDREGREDCH